MRKSSLIANFFIFIIGLILLTIILSTAVGQLGLYHILSYMSLATPEYLSEDVATFLTVLAYAPGDSKAAVRITSPHTFEIQKLGNNYQVVVDPGPSMPFLYDRNKVERTTVKIQTGQSLFIKKINNELFIDGNP